MFDGRWRGGIERGLEPLAATIRRTGISPDAITVFGVCMAGIASVVLASGALLLALAIGVFAGLADAIDGAVAKVSGHSSRRGAFLDSVADRVSDAMIYTGLTWYLATAHSGRIAVLPMAVFAVASLVSYQRAKAESLGFEARGGLMERAERMVALGFGVLFSQLLIPVLWLMLVLTSGTAVHRFVGVWRQAGAPQPDATPEPRPAPTAETTRERRTRRERRTDRPTTRTWRERVRARRAQ